MYLPSKLCQAFRIFFHRLLITSKNYLEKSFFHPTARTQTSWIHRKIAQHLTSIAISSYLALPLPGDRRQGFHPISSPAGAQEQCQLWTFSSRLELKKNMGTSRGLWASICALLMLNACLQAQGKQLSSFTNTSYVFCTCNDLNMFLLLLSIHNFFLTFTFEFINQLPMSNFGY